MRTADRLFGNDYHWSVLGAGRSQLPIATQHIALTAMCASGWRTHSGSARASWRNPDAEQVKKVRQIIEGFGA
ncbi:uncharacterized protein (DUF849 family) [Mesorhizobium sp. URHB0026]